MIVFKSGKHKVDFCLANHPGNMTYPKAEIKPRPLFQIFNSKTLLMRVCRYLILLILAFMGIAGLRNIIVSLQDPVVYRKDFIQEYLLAKSALAGINPYQPLPVLANNFLGSLPNLIFPHPTPHPPPVIFITLPLGLFTYSQAATIWAIFEAGMLAVAVYGLFSLINSNSRSPQVWWKNLLVVVLVTFLAFGWVPVMLEMSLGQLEILLLALLVWGWLALRANKDIWGGLLLGCVLALKLFAWPVVLYLIMKKRWRAVISTAVVTLVLNIAAGFVIGFDQLLNYYLNISSESASLYKATSANFSLWTIGYRVFSETSNKVLFSIYAPPLIRVPQLAPYFAIILPAVFLILSLIVARKFKNFDHAFGLLICTSLLVNPISWPHYLVLSPIPMIIIARRLFDFGLPRIPTYVGMLAGLLSNFPFNQSDQLLVALGYPGNEQYSSIAPFWLSLISLLPALIVLLLFTLLWRLDLKYIIE